MPKILSLSHIEAHLITSSQLLFNDYNDLKYDEIVFPRKIVLLILSWVHIQGTGMLFYIPVQCLVQVLPRQINPINNGHWYPKMPSTYIFIAKSEHSISGKTLSCSDSVVYIPLHIRGLWKPKNPCLDVQYLFLLKLYS